MLLLSCKLGGISLHTYWVIVLKKSSSTEYVLNEHEALRHYGPYAVPPEMMLFGVYPASSAILFDKLVDLFVNVLSWP